MTARSTELKNLPNFDSDSAILRCRTKTPVLEQKRWHNPPRLSSTPLFKKKRQCFPGQRFHHFFFWTNLEGSLRRKDHCGYRLHTQFEIFRGTVSRVDVGGSKPGSGADERALPSIALHADRWYLMDRGYAKFLLWNVSDH